MSVTHNTVLQTTNYSQFKTILGNRSTQPRSIRYLEGQIVKNNLLSFFPILINENREIIDGQHRLAVAKKLGLPISYIVVDGLTIADVIALNTSQKPWRAVDYLELHIALKNDSYIAIREFMQKWSCPLSVAVGFLNNERGFYTVARDQFKQGRFVLGDVDQAHYLMTQIHDLRPNMRVGAVMQEKAFLSAFKRTALSMEDDEHDISEFADALRGQGYVIESYTRARDYLRDFQFILDRAKIKVDVRYDV